MEHICNGAVPAHWKKRSSGRGLPRKRISVAVTDSLYDLNMVFVKSQIDINDKVFRTIKGRTQFISCAYH